MGARGDADLHSNLAMNIDSAQILALAAAGEGKTVEFKRGLQHDAKIARTLAAFANTRGGILLVGIGDDGEILGAPHPPRTREHLHAIARERVEPPLEVETELVRVKEKPIVVCSVPFSAARPHAAIDDEGAREIVVRAGSSNRAASGKALDELRAPRKRARDLSELERVVLDWFTARAALAEARATLATFLAAHSVGKQSARHAFLALEHAGFLVAHGVGDARVYRRTQSS